MTPDPPADSPDLLAAFRHDHVFLGDHHDRNGRKVWVVIAICAAMMAAEIVGGAVFHSMALIADGAHMSTHAGAMLIAALAYGFARRHAHDPRFSFGTGKLGDLSAFTSAVILLMIALFIGFESLQRLFHLAPIAYDEAIAIAVLGLGVNLLTAWFLRDEPEHGHGHTDHGEQAEPDHDHGHGGRRLPTGKAHGDLNLRAAYVHVLADSAIAVLTIVGLGAGRLFGWTWMDPIMGLIGTLAIVWWAIGLLRAAGAMLLDMRPAALAEAIARRLPAPGETLTDLHVWRVGPGHTAAIATLASRHPAPHADYRARLAGLDLSHLTLEIVPLGPVEAAADAAPMRVRV